MPPSKSTSKASTTRKKKAVKAKPEVETNEDDFGFGAGLDDESEAPEPKAKAEKPKKKRVTKKATKKVAKPAVEAVVEESNDFGNDDIDFGSDDEFENDISPKAKKKKKAGQAQKSEVSSNTITPDTASSKTVTSEITHSETVHSGTDDSDSNVPASVKSDSVEPKSSDSEGSEEKKSRRRRRRRKGSGAAQDSGTQPQANNQQSGGQQSGGQNRQRNQQGRQRNNNQQNNRRNNTSNSNSNSGGNGGGGNRGDNQRGRRVSKFEQNAAPIGPVQTSGTIEGILELHPKGYGFLRLPANDYGARETDTFVSSTFVEKHNLREGILIKGEVGPGTRGQGPRLLEIESIDGNPPEEFEKIQHFDTLTPINPFEQIKLETGPTPITMRVLDLLCPIGKGQRALLVAPPRSGKTMLMQDIANSVSKNHPEIHLIVLLVDERPEEVTELRRNIKGEVVASSMDLDVESHVRISQLVFERGKRIAESGKDCFILMDSITRTARAFNKWMRGDRNTKIQTGGLDVRALDIPRKMFGTARRFDEGGSLTVCATALIDTGSRMDEAIFQEFKGTGNMELQLSRDLADRRIWPAVDIARSGTRREEKILDPAVLDGVIMLRRSLISMNSTEAMDQLIRTLQKFESNKEFLERIRSVL